MSNSPLFSCCDCCFGAAKKTPEQQGQEVALLPPEKVFEFQQVRERKVSGEEEDGHKGGGVKRGERWVSVGMITAVKGLICPFAS